MSLKVQGRVGCLRIRRSWNTKENKIMWSFLEHKGAGGGWGWETLRLFVWKPPTGFRRVWRE